MVCRNYDIFESECAKRVIGENEVASEEKKRKK
jgi:hypothetical protein